MYQKRIHNLFKDVISDQSSSSQSEYEENKVKKKQYQTAKTKDDAVYGSFDFSDIIKGKTNESKK